MFLFCELTLEGVQPVPLLRVFRHLAANLLDQLQFGLGGHRPSAKQRLIDLRAPPGHQRSCGHFGSLLLRGQQGGQVGHHVEDAVVALSHGCHRIAVETPKSKDISHKLNQTKTKDYGSV